MKYRRYYIAYGSNLNVTQMKHRCPMAKLQGTTVLMDYCLRFYGAKTNSVATVEPCDGSFVPVLIWAITPRDEENLDVYEGYPRLYRKEMRLVSLNGKTVEAMIYIMNTELYDEGLPSEFYYQTILKGYKDAKMDSNILREATLHAWERDIDLLFDTKKADVMSEESDTEMNNDTEPEEEFIYDGDDDNGIMTDTIREQIMAIRDSGETNMLDVRTVQYIANREEYYELVVYLEDHRDKYVHFIFTGETS
ncbi:DUF5049 domain-containing protein [Candidatus Saccharibacteria bacterium]|nr:DUF5049 domain-containing protein [Candidatus Saccharibacteria bacterium]